MTAPTCCLCGADESQGPLDPRRCYDQPAGSVRCVSVNECSLRAELRDLRAEVMRVAGALEMAWGADARNAARELRKAVTP